MESAEDSPEPEGPFQTCVVLMLGYPGMGKRTVGSHLAALFDGVLVDNALINRPVLELFRWDGVALLPTEIWSRVAPIREAVLGVIEDLAPSTTSYVFTNVLEDTAAAELEYERLRELAGRRGSLFLSVMLSCDVEVQVGRIANPDRVALRKGSDPEAYRGHRERTALFEPPAAEVVRIDTTTIPPAENARRILDELRARGFSTAGSQDPGVSGD